MLLRYKATPIRTIQSDFPQLVTI